MLPSDSHAAQVGFTLDAVAAAAVESTRKRGPRGGPRPPGGPSPGPPARDILLLHPTGRLSLYIGSRHVCNVAVNVRDPGRVARYAPVTLGGRSAERGAVPTLYFSSTVYFQAHT